MSVTFLRLVLLVSVGITCVKTERDLPYMKTDYDGSLPPRTDKPTEMKIGMYINSFYGISSKDMEYGFSGYIRQSWTDPRLASDDPSTGNQRYPNGAWDEIWTPDIFFRNEKEASEIDILAPQRLLKVNETGGVWYVTKYRVKLSCPMKLQKFPFDTQSCPLMIESFGYTMDVLYFNWLDNPVDVDDGNELPDFYLRDAVLYDCSQNYTGGAFPCLEVRFILERGRGHYFLVVFIPSAIIVIISWIQFWMPADAVTGRVLVGLFSTFTLVAQMTGLRGSLPAVSYITALDVWFLACLLFSALTLLELAVTQVVDRRGGQGEQGESGKESVSSKIAASRIDFVARIGFPVGYLLFCIIYFSIYAA